MAWRCPRTGVNTFELGTGSRQVDFNCNGVVGDRPFKADLNGDQTTSTLVGNNDWASLQFAGGGVIGALDLPIRPNPTDIVPELTREEMQRAHADEQRFRKRRRQQLVVVTGTRRLRVHRSTTIRVRVIAGTKPVRRAVIRVRGAKMRRAVVKTDRRGRARLTLRPTRRRGVTILAKRGGYGRGGVVIPTRRRR